MERNCILNDARARTLSVLPGIAARSHPLAPAVVGAKGDRYTYGELYRQSCDLAKGLLALGVQKGAHIAIMIPNSPEHLFVKFAVQMVGAVAVNMNYHEKAPMMELLLNKAQVEVLFISPDIRQGETLHIVESVLPRVPKLTRVVLVERPDRRCEIDRAEYNIPGLLESGALCARGASMPDEAVEARAQTVTPDDPSTIIHSSGTTSTPKGVVLTHRAILENVRMHLVSMRLTPEDRLCMTPPMFHSFGCIGSALTIFSAGGTLICYHWKCGEDLSELLAREKCTVLCSVPTVYVRMVQKIREGELPKSGPFVFHTLVAAGAACPETLLKDMKEVLHAQEILIMYGMTEAGPGISSTEPGDPLDVLQQTVGRPWPGVQIKIGPLPGECASLDGSGELLVKSPSLMQCYLNEPEETAHAFDAEGFLHTGDIARLRPDGRLELCGRCKDLIIHGGENITPGEIEVLLRTNENVADAVVVGVPSYKYGEDIFAFVKLKEGAQPLTADEVKAFCKGKIASIKIPEYVQFVDSFPVSDTGKILKRILRDDAKKIVGKD